MNTLRNVFSSALFLCTTAYAANIAVTLNPVAAARTIAHPKASLRAVPRGAALRRVTGAIAAVADIGDMLSTHRALCTSLSLFECQTNGLAHEVNPVFAPNGPLLAKRFDVTKLIIAGAIAGGEELPAAFHAPHLDAWNRAMTVANVPAALFFTGLTINNEIVYSQTHK